MTEPVEKSGWVVPEYLVQLSIDGVAQEASELFQTLIGDKAFCEVDLCPPELDLSDDAWKLPHWDTSGSTGRPVTIEEFTNEEGTGDFDQMAEGVRNILREEYDKQRITSTDYAKGLTALLEATLNNATQFTLQKEAAYWTAQKTLYEAYSARAQAELLKQQIAMARIQIANQQMEYAQGKLGLLNGKYQVELTAGQRDVTLPKQAESQDSQMALYEQQIESYKRNAEMQYAGKLQDLWIAMYGINEGELQDGDLYPEASSSWFIDQSVKAIGSKLNIPAPVKP